MTGVSGNAANDSLSDWNRCGESYNVASPTTGGYDDGARHGKRRGALMTQPLYLDAGAMYVSPARTDVMSRGATL